MCYVGGGGGGGGGGFDSNCNDVQGVFFKVH